MLRTLRYFLLLALFYVWPSSVLADDSPERSDFVSYRELIAGLHGIALNQAESSEVIQKEYADFILEKALAETETNFKEYVFVRLAFELTRDSGLWRIKWGVTNREPNSDNIWRQWSNLSDPKLLALDEPTATAECDELSALFAVVARDLGVKKVGLFWPAWNHTVAVWTAQGRDGKPKRIVVPTSQIYLSQEPTLGTDEFDPYKQKTIYDYNRKDVSSDFLIPLPLAKMFLAQAKQLGERGSTELQKERNSLSERFGGS